MASKTSLTFDIFAKDHSPAELSKFAKNVDSTGKKVTTGLTDPLDKAGVAAKSFGDDVKAATGSTHRIGVQVDSTGKKIRSWGDAVTRGGKASKAGFDKAGAAAKDLGSDVKREMRKIDAAFDGSRKEVQQFEKQIKDVEVKVGFDDSEAESGMDGFLSDFKDKAKVGGAAIGAILAAAAMDTISAEADVDRSVASLGLNPKQAARLGETAGRLFASNWAGSMGEASEAVEAVIGSIGGMRSAGVKDLERISSKAAAFADQYEIDINRVAQVTGQMIRTGFAKNADQAFDLLFAASQRVPPAIREDLVDAIDEYGPFFQTLGFNGQQAFGVLVEGSKKGMFGIDKAGDAVKEFTIRSTDMSTTTKAAYKRLGLDTQRVTNLLLAGGDGAKVAFNQIITGLLDIEDPGKRAQSAIALFGTPLEDLNVREIPSFLRGLRDGGHEMKNFAGTANKSMDTMSDNVESDFKTLMNGLRAGAQDTIAGLFSGDWSRVGDGLTQIFDNVKTLYRKYWRQILTIGSFGLSLVVQAIIDHWSDIVGFFKNTWDDIKGFFSGGWKKVKGATGDGIGWVKDKIGAGWGWVKDTTSGAWNKVTDVVGNAWDSIENKISGVWTGGIKPVFDAMKAAVGLIPKPFRAAKDAIGDVWQKIKDTIANPIDWVIDTVWNNGIVAALDKIPGLSTESWKHPGIPGYASGGWTGSGPKDKVAGLVHAKEFVINAESTKRIERTNPGFLENLNKTGLPGHKVGGFVDPDKTVYVDGEPLSAVHAAQLFLAGQLMGARQYVMQGSWQAPSSYSGTSHTGPGVADTSPGTFRAQAVQRRVGIAAWARNIPGAAYAGSGAHIHGVSLLSPGARGNSQAAAYKAGGDGLGGPDYGPRPSLMPGLMDKLSQFDPSVFAGASGFGSAQAQSTGLFDSALAAATAVPKFIMALDDIWTDIDSMAGRGGWSQPLSKAPGAVMGKVKSYGLEKLKDAGSWVRDDALDYTPIGAARNQAQAAWDAVSGADLPGGWWGNGLQGGIFTKPTVIGVGDKGPERVDVTPLRHMSSGPRKLILEGPMTFTVNGQQITGAVRGIVREELEDEFSYQMGG